MAEKHPPQNLNSICDKDLNIPKEFEPQLEFLKTILLEIDEKKNSDKATSSKDEHTQSEGKKAKTPSVKTQLASYKKELKETKEEIERVTKALSIMSEVRNACLTNLITVKKAGKGSSSSRKENLPAVLKETAETLPLWVGDNNAIPPLCGATQVDDDYVAKAGDNVAAFVTVKGKKLKEWILAEVSDYNNAMSEYEVRDIEEKSLIYTLKSDKIIPLPTMRANPVEHPDAVFPKGTTVLALYEGTTCFYKGMVDEPPVDSHKPYQIVFEDADCASGYSSPTSVAQRYVLAYREFDSS